MRRLALLMIVMVLGLGANSLYVGGLIPLVAPPMTGSCRDRQSGH